MNSDLQAKEKRKWSIIIGFLTIILFGIFGMLTSAAAEGNIIARWVLLIIFGAIAVALASYALGYIILLIVGKPKEDEEVPPKPAQKRIQQNSKKQKQRKKTKKR